MPRNVENATGFWVQVVKQTTGQNQKKKDWVDTELAVLGTLSCEFGPAARPSFLQSLDTHASYNYKRARHSRHGFWKLWRREEGALAMGVSAPRAKNLGAPTRNVAEIGVAMARFRGAWSPLK